MGLSNSVTQFFATRRFRPRWLPTLGMIAVVAITVALGNWQRHRAIQKETLAAQFATAAGEPPVELIPDDTDAARLRFRIVRATGEYEAARQLFVDNKVHAGRAGFEVVAPLKLAASNRYVLVDRGWIAQGARRADLPDVPPPRGLVTVVGRANLPPQQYLELKHERPAGPLWQNLDLGRIAAATGLDFFPVVIEQAEGVPADGLVRDWPAPDLGANRNRSYMLQWYSFAALAVVLWLALNWRARDADAGH
ncbi:MAG: SURF1 family protein [Pseudomonadota bacterium]|nr:SURF1 family protein [Pseudomonadota bacterium]